MRDVSIVLNSYPWTAPVLDHEVGVDGFRFVFEPYEGTEQRRQMMHELRFDVCEMSWFMYLAARDLGIGCTAIPYFPSWTWPHEMITVNVGAGIAEPRDLQGRRLGMNTYLFTPGVWLRGFLADHYGVDTATIHHVLSAEESVPNFVLPANVELRKGTKLGPLVATGELDAGIAIAPPNGTSVVKLFDDAQDLRDLWLQSAIVPIDHCLVIRDDFVREHPGFVGPLYEALVQAGSVFRSRLENGQLSAEELRIVNEGGIVDSGPVPAGIEANRTMLEASIRYAEEQQVITKPLAVEQLFI